jgi:hypothetical protein
MMRPLLMEMWINGLFAQVIDVVKAEALEEVDGISVQSIRAIIGGHPQRRALRPSAQTWDVFMEHGSGKAIVELIDGFILRIVKHGKGK